MADEADTLELSDDMLVADDDEPQDEGDQQAENDELDLEIEGDDAGEETPAIRDLRTKYRDAQRELSERRKNDQPKVIERGQKPTAESCEWDDERLERELTAWVEAGQAAKDAETRQQQQVQAKNQQFERAKGKYLESAGRLAIKNFDGAQQAVIDAMGPDFLGAIIQYADDPAKLVGALGNNPNVLARVAAEDDPIMRLKMLLKTEAKIVTKRKAPPAPEADTIQRGTAPIARNPDKKLAALEDKARKTGDRSELIAYKQQNRDK